MSAVGPMDFLRAAQFLRSGDLDDFAEIVDATAPAPDKRPGQPADKPESPHARSA